MHDVEAQAVNRSSYGSGTICAPSSLCVKRAEPRIVIAGHYRECSAPALEFSQTRVRLSFRIRVAGRDREAIQKSQRSPAIKRASSAVNRLKPIAEATVAIGSIESQVDIAGEIMRHDR